MAGEPGGLRGDIIPGTPLCCTVIVCLKSEGKLILEPGSFFSSFNLDLLNFPVKDNFQMLDHISDVIYSPFLLLGVGVCCLIIKCNSRSKRSISLACNSCSFCLNCSSCILCCNWARFKSSSLHRNS